MDFLRANIEEKIQDAIRRGEFDNLPGAGKPLPPDDMLHVPEELRVGYKMLKNAGLIPEEMQLRKEMVTLNDLLAVCRDDAERTRLRKELSLKQLRYQSLMSDRSWAASGAFAEYESQVQRKLAEPGSSAGASAGSSASASPGSSASASAGSSSGVDASSSAGASPGSSASASAGSSSGASPGSSASASPGSGSGASAGSSSGVDASSKSYTSPGSN